MTVDFTAQQGIRNYRMCRRCVMDTSDPEIRFNDEGICNHCLRYDERFQKEVFKGDPDRVGRLVERIKKAGKGKKYDCVAGVSGGVDSTYVCYLLKKKFGLRPIAVHFDNSWNSELAVKNIENTLKRLEIDLYTHVVDWEEFKDLQLSVCKAGVENLEGPTDHAINALLLKTAAKFNVKYIISGGNLATEGILPRAWSYDSRDLKYLKGLHKKYGTKKMKTFPKMNLLEVIYLLGFRMIKIVPLLNYVHYAKEEAINILKDELDWKPYPFKHGESIFTRFFQGYILPERFGYDKRRAHFSTMICSGQMSREQAIEKLKEPIYDSKELEEEKNYVIKKFELTEDEFDRLIHLPKKTVHDYPSHSWLFHNSAFIQAVKKVVLQS